jgi:CubicO group peptidase (beta-lactamase class C family)
MICWLYSNWDFNAADAAFEQMTGTNIYDALPDNLAIPIGMQYLEREQCAFPKWQNSSR